MDDFDEGLEATPFPEVVQALCTPGRDENSTKTAAVASALVEVIQEKLGADSFEKISPPALFASALNALSATITNDQDVGSSPQLSLLEILQQVIPYVSSSNPNLYLHQFTNTSRALRGVIASIPTSHQVEDQSKISSGWNALLRSCIRTAATALNGILVLENAKSMEKEILKCFQYTILNNFDDSRAKVRRQAHSSTIELLHLSQNMEEGLVQLIPSHLTEYAHHILLEFQNKKKNKKLSEFEKKERVVRLMHLLSFLEHSLAIMSQKGRLTLGKDLMQLLAFALGVDANDDIQRSTMVANGSLAALLQIFDNSNREFDSADKDSSEEDAFCAQQWATLIQANAKLVQLTSTGNEGTGECRSLYAKAVIAISLRLLSDDISEQQKPVMKALIPKLLPLSFTTVINCVGDEDISESAVQGICAELGRQIRSDGFKKMLQEEASNATYGKCIEACIGSLQKIQQYRYRSNWDACLPCVATLVVSVIQGMIPSTGADEATMTKMQARVKPMVTALVQLYSDVDDKSSKQVIEGAIGNIVEGVGAEIFMGLVDLCDGSKQSNVVKGAISTERAWILNVIKSSLSMDSNPYRPRLAFFQSHVLGLARKCDMASANDHLTAVEASIQRSRVVDLWCLFPSFCLHPLDIEVTFPALAQTLVRAMSDKRYPELLTIICTGLTALVKDAQERSENDMNSNEGVQAELRILSECSTKILPSLFRLVESLHGVDVSKKGSKDEDMDVEDEEETKKNLSQEAQRVMTVTDAIAAYASIAPEEFLKSLFKKVVQRLLAASQSDGDETEKMCTLLGLAQALVKSQCLNDDSVSLLYRSIKPLIKSDEQGSRVQKRAYKVFAEICQHYTSFVTAPERLSEIIDLMIGSTIVLQVSARHMRLKCIKFVAEGFDSNNKAQMDIIPNIVGEVLLSLKDSNAKTRESAYQVLLSLAQVRNDMTTYLQIIVGALGAQTPHMRSAAVMALSRLVFQYARTDFTVQNLLPNLLQTVILLFDENSREVIKSVIGFVRVSVAALNKDQLEPLLPELVGGMMKYNRGKGRFRAKIKIIIKKLVRYYGYEKITPLVPANDTRLLNHMRKLAERTARRRAANIQDGATAVGEFDDLMDSDEDDSDDGRTFMTGVTGFTKMTMTSRKSGKTAMSAKSIAKSVRSMTKSMASMKSSASTGPRIDTRGEKGGEILDMLDPKMSKNVRFNEEQDDDGFSDDDEAMEFDDSGKLVVGGDDKIHFSNNDDDAEEERGGKRQRISKFESAKANREEAHNKKNKKNQQQKKTQQLGAAYKSKKAGGDVKRKDQKFEPYAFVPLDGKKYTKKARGQTVEQMSTVVRGKGGFKRKRR